MRDDTRTKTNPNLFPNGNKFGFHYIGGRKGGYMPRQDSWAVTPTAADHPQENRHEKRHGIHLPGGTLHGGGMIPEPAAVFLRDPGLPP